MGVATPPALRAVEPRDGATVSTNTPDLAWPAASHADTIEVWIDGRCHARLPGHTTRFVPFPLSSGRHEWHLVVIDGASRTVSPRATFTVAAEALADGPAAAVGLNDGWFMQSAAVVGTDGAALSRRGIDPADWLATSLPATALTVLVRHGVYPDPYRGLGNTRIPDANDAYNAAHDLLRWSHLPGLNPWKEPYWFVRPIIVPASLAGRRLRLVFNEINYRADVWLNGERLAGADTLVGMARVFRLDLGDRLKADGPNWLAVAIHPVDVPGRPAPMAVRPLDDPGRNMGDDAAISLNYTKWDTVGWDWQPPVPDRDMGITGDVWLEPVAEVEVVKPYVGAELPAPDGPADLRIACTLINRTAAPRAGEVAVEIADEQGATVSFTQPFTLAAGEERDLRWTPVDRPALHLAHPRLWWPAGMGEPHLYTLTVRTRIVGAEVATATTTFGIRRIDTDISPTAGSRQFRINGRPLFLQGGNWVADMMLNATASRYRQEIEAASRAHLNFLRVWGPTGVPPDVFFDAADRAGVLIWQDFLHDHWGTDQNAPGFAPPLDVYERSTRAVIERLRNHPSLFLWCGGNEGPNPREALITRTLLPQLDPWGSRHYLPASLADGVHGGGPYHTLTPREYFGHPKLTGFNSEIGPSGVPEWESLEQFLDFPPREWAPGRFPLDGEWAYHNATDRQSDQRRFSLFDDLVRHTYGAPAGHDLAAARLYARRAQFVNYDAYRAALEAVSCQLGTRATGLCLWKFNASWPSLTWQITDWYQQFHAGYYATRRALEPQHVQFDPADRTVAVVNRRADAALAGRLEAVLVDAAGRTVWERGEEVACAPFAVQTPGWTVPPAPGLTFLRLRLCDADGRLVSESTYWLGEPAALQSLATLRPSELAVTVARGAAREWHVRVTNGGPVPAVLLRLRAIDPVTGAELLPTWWSDNYVTLLPGASTEVTAGFPTAPPGAVELSGDNFTPIRIAVP